MSNLELILSGVTATLSILCGLLVKSYLPAYVKEKATNLATKEDIADITSRVERVRTAISQEAALLEKRREVYERITNALRIFIAGHVADNTAKEEFHSAYSACWLWAPDNLLNLLNQFIAIQHEIAVDQSSHGQDEMKKLFGDIMLAMRKDTGFADTDVKKDQYRFVKF